MKKLLVLFVAMLILSLAMSACEPVTVNVNQEVNVNEPATAPAAQSETVEKSAPPATQASTVLAPAASNDCTGALPASLEPQTVPAGCMALGDVDVVLTSGTYKGYDRGGSGQATVVIALTETQVIAEFGAGLEPVPSYSSLESIAALLAADEKATGCGSTCREARIIIVQNDAVVYDQVK